MKSDLYFTKICFKNKYGSHEAINALLDTGAANSLIHKSVARRLNLDFEPLSMRLCTASGFDNNAIIGKSQAQFILHSKNDNKMLCCTNFIITKKLNDLQAIFGAEFLFNENRTVMLQKNEITILYNNKHFRLKMNKISEKENYVQNLSYIRNWI